ncbi:MAG TPA: hypothetical protein VM285_03145, partial [Polyangia bacterium]|nr:hypothetical protein [Polyangia bacterium]
ALRTVRIQRNGGQLPVEVTPGAEPTLLNRGYATATLTVSVDTAEQAASIQALIDEYLGHDPSIVVSTIHPDREAISTSIEAAREEADDDTVYPEDLAGLVTAERGRHVRIS